MDKTTQSKHWSKKNHAIIQSYWESKPATKRSIWFVDQLKALQFNSICEAGMFSGRNLYYIQKEFPNIKISGFDVNLLAVKFAQQKISNAKFWAMDIHNLSQHNEKYDIIYTSGTLIHLPPDTITPVLQSMLNTANKYVLHIESIGPSEVMAGPKDMKPKYKVSDQIQFSVDLVEKYKTLGYDACVVDLPNEVRTNGASELVIIKK